MATRDGMTSAQKEQKRVDAVAQDILDRINEYRGRKCMKLGEFADFIGVSRSQYSKWCNGEVGCASFSSLMTAAIRCGIKFEVSCD